MAVALAADGLMCIAARDVLGRDLASDSMLTLNIVVARYRCSESDKFGSVVEALEGLGSDPSKAIRLDPAGALAKDLGASSAH